MTETVNGKERIRLDLLSGGSGDGHEHNHHCGYQSEWQNRNRRHDHPDYEPLFSADLERLKREWSA